MWNVKNMGDGPVLANDPQVAGRAASAIYVPRT
jgi:hypothetical protein